MTNLIKPKSRNYCFTLFNKPTINLEYFKFRYLIYQEEICPKTKKIHWQGYAEFNKEITLRQIKQDFLQDDTSHIEMRNGTREQARHYCMKPIENCKCKHCIKAIIENYKPNQYKEFGKWTKGQGHRSDIDEMAYNLMKGIINEEDLKNDYSMYYLMYYNTIKKIINEMKEKEQLLKLKKKFQNTTLRKWQQQTLSSVSDQGDRKVKWIYDEDGNSGKTYLSKYMVATQNAYYVTSGKTKDIIYGYKNQPLVIFDFSRSQEDHINYQAIELFKNGIMFNSKYESGMKIFDSCKIVCMSNFYPNINALSKDRWDINILKEGKIKKTEPPPRLSDRPLV